MTVLEGLGHGLDEAAVDAIQSSGCRFTPAMTGEGPVPADLVYTFHFQLPR